MNKNFTPKNYCKGHNILQKKNGFLSCNHHQKGNLFYHFLITKFTCGSQYMLKKFNNFLIPCKLVLY